MIVYFSPEGEPRDYKDGAKKPDGHYSGDEMRELDYNMPKIPEGRRALLNHLIAKRLDSFAAEKQYDTIFTAMGVALTTAFKADGEAAIKAYDATWEAVVKFFPAVESGELTAFDVMKRLPAITWG